MLLGLTGSLSPVVDCWLSSKNNERKKNTRVKPIKMNRQNSNSKRRCCDAYVRSYSCELNDKWNGSKGRLIHFQWQHGRWEYANEAGTANFSEGKEESNATCQLACRVMMASRPWLQDDWAETWWSGDITIYPSTLTCSFIDTYKIPWSLLIQHQSTQQPSTINNN